MMKMFVMGPTNGIKLKKMRIPLQPRSWQRLVYDATVPTMKKMSTGIPRVTIIASTQLGVLTPESINRANAINGSQVMDMLKANLRRPMRPSNEIRDSRKDFII